MRIESRELMHNQCKVSSWKKEQVLEIIGSVLHENVDVLNATVYL